MDPKLKRSLFAVLWSIFLPGAGQIYLGKISRGVIFLIISFSLRAIVFAHYFLPNTKGSPNFLTLLSLAVFLYIAFDAFRIGNRKDVSISNKRSLILFVSYFLVVGGMALYIRQYIIQPFKVPSDAMSPTILVGDRIYVDKRAYKTEDPKAGDIVVFISPQDSKKDYVKRVVGLPNETLEIKNGDILINGQPLTKPEVFKKLYYYNRGNFGSEGLQIKIPENDYFVLGDNSSSSYDSRYWGFVSKSAILGKVYKRYFPFDRSGPIE